MGSDPMMLPASRNGEPDGSAMTSGCGPPFSCVSAYRCQPGWVRASGTPSTSAPAFPAAFGSIFGVHWTTVCAAASEAVSNAARTYTAAFNGDALPREIVQDRLGVVNDG